MRYSEGLDMPGVPVDMASALDQEGTRTNHGSRIIYTTEKPVCEHVQSSTFGLLVEAS